MLSVIIFAEILIVILTMKANFVTHRYYSPTRNLAAILLADDESPPPEAPPESPPPDSPPPESPPPESPPPEIPPAEVPPAEAPPAEIPPAPPENVNPDNQNPPETQPENQLLPGEQVNQQEANQISQAGALNSPENVDPAVTAAVENQENQLAAIQDPVEKAGALIKFADEDISLIDQKVSPTDFASANILAQIITEHLDQALKQIGGLSFIQGRALKQKLAVIAEHADRIFRTEQLVVPEQMEQEFEITRGVFLNIKQLK